MDDDIKSKMLKEQIEKIGQLSGAAGGFIGGGILGGLAGALGGKSGAQWAANKLKTFDYKDKVECKFSTTDVIKNSYYIVVNLPNFIELINSNANPGIPFLAAVVGSGFGKMNPTIICLEFAPSSETSTAIYISASAKEGLIRQYSAQKAVMQLRACLASFQKEKRIVS